MKMLIVFLSGVIVGLIVGIIRGAEVERAKNTFKPTQETWLELEKFKWMNESWCAKNIHKNNGGADDSTAHD